MILGGVHQGPIQAHSPFTVYRSPRITWVYPENLVTTVAKPSAKEFFIIGRYFEQFDTSASKLKCKLKFQ